MDYLQTVTEGKSLVARLYRPLQSSSDGTPVDVYDGAVNLGNLMVQRGYAAQPAQPSLQSSLQSSPQASPGQRGPGAAGAGVPPCASSPSRTKGSKQTAAPSPQRDKRRGLLDTPPMQGVGMR